MLVAAPVATWASSWLITTCAPAPLRPRVTSGLTKTWTGAPGAPTRPRWSSPRRCPRRSRRPHRGWRPAPTPRTAPRRRPTAASPAARGARPPARATTRRAYVVTSRAAPGRDADTITSAVPVRRTVQRRPAATAARHRRPRHRSADGHRVAVRHEGDDHLRAGRLAVEAPDGPRERDRGRPGAVARLPAPVSSTYRAEKSVTSRASALSATEPRAGRARRCRPTARGRVPHPRRCDADGLLEPVQGGRRGTGARSAPAGAAGAARRVSPPGRRAGPRRPPAP